MATESPEMLATSIDQAGEIALGAGPVEVALAPARSSGALAPRLAAIEPGRKLYLVVRGLRADHQPEVHYRVYLALPRGAEPQEGPHHVGSFNFHNAVINAEGARPRTASPRFFSYEVTDLIKALQERKLLEDPVTVTIAPAGEPKPGAKPSVGEIALITQ